MGHIAPPKTVTEPTPISDVFADGVVEIEIIGTIVRYVFSSRQKVAGTNGYEHVIVAKLVMPLDAAADLNSQARIALHNAMAMHGGGHC